MKKQTLVVFTTLLLLTSCVVKSLEPFYTKKSISYDERLIGEWTDAAKGHWKIQSIKEEIEKDSIKEVENLLYEVYKKSYYLIRTYKEKETEYIVTPFQVKGNTFLDFYPIDNQERIDNLLEKHTIFTHSLVKYELDKDGNLSIKWLDEDKIEDLFEQKKIKIQHHKIGLTKDKYLLTASSEDLERFIEKYISSDDETKWKTDTKFTLKRVEESE